MVAGGAAQGVGEAVGEGRLSAGRGGMGCPLDRRPSPGADRGRGVGRVVAQLSGEAAGTAVHLDARELGGEQFDRFRVDFPPPVPGRRQELDVVGRMDSVENGGPAVRRSLDTVARTAQRGLQDLEAFGALRVGDQLAAAEEPVRIVGDGPGRAEHLHARSETGLTGVGRA